MATRKELEQRLIKAESTLDELGAYYRVVMSTVSDLVDSQVYFNSEVKERLDEIYQNFLESSGKLDDISFLVKSTLDTEPHERR